MPSPTYKQNKIHQYKWIEKNRVQFNLNRIKSYWRKKSPYYRESELFRRILLNQ